MKNPNPLPTATICYDPSQPLRAVWHGDRKVELFFKWTLRVYFKSFPKESNLYWVTLTSAEDGKSINFPTGESASSIFRISLELNDDDVCLNDKVLEITCQDEPKYDKKYYMSVSGRVGGVDKGWKIDPEVISRARTINRPGSSDDPKGGADADK